MASIFDDNFNSYYNGDLAGQGSWATYHPASANFDIQGTITKEGAKAVYNSTAADSVISKMGAARADGKTTVYFRTVTHASWGSSSRYSAIRIGKGVFGAGGEFAAIYLFDDGYIKYYDGSAFQNVHTTDWNDDQWYYVQIEWRTSDNKARYNFNGGTWTGWDTFFGSAGFTDFDNVGLNLYMTGGSGGIYFDHIAEDVIAAGPANVKSVDTVAIADLKSMNGIAKANLHSVNGIT